MKEVKTDMAGNVWKVLVSDGDSIKSGDNVVILESMKMEIPIQAGADGKVKNVNVHEGDFVEEGKVLLEIEI